jgi:predicted ribosomally synthesized peptide with SipW-like signal peptide
MAVIVCVGIVGSSLAYFTDVETSTGNTFTAGTLILKLSDKNEGFGDGVTATWTMDNMQPGVTSVGPLSVNLQNSGNIAGNHVEISFSHDIDEDANPVESDSDPASDPGDIARWLQIITMTYDTIDFLDSYTDANHNGFFDLEDLTMSPYADEAGPLDNLPTPPPNNGGTTSLTMKLKFNAGATNDIQGDILTTTVTFTLNQDASQ